MAATHIMVEQQLMEQARGSPDVSGKSRPSRTYCRVYGSASYAFDRRHQHKKILAEARKILAAAR